MQYYEAIWVSTREIYGHITKKSSLLYFVMILTDKPINQW